MDEGNPERTGESRGRRGKIEVDRGRLGQIGGRSRWMGKSRSGRGKIGANGGKLGRKVGVDRARGEGQGERL